MQIAADPILPQAAAECEKEKMPFALAIFVGEDADRVKIADNKYYAGAINADMYYDGYIIGKIAAQDGHKTAVLIGGNVGDIHFEQRIEGFTKAFVEEGGGKILSIARCSSPAEGQEKANALLSANRGADCLYAMVGDYVPGSVNALDTLGLKDIAVYGSNVGKETVDYIKEGRVTAGGAGNDVAGGLASALLMNFLDGHPILDENGKPPELKLQCFVVDKTNVDDFESLFLSDGARHPLTEDVLKSLTWRFNNDVSYKTFTDLIADGLTLEALLAAPGR
jgi:ABC-type sugar transport system substrate-binding protein